MGSQASRVANYPMEVVHGLPGTLASRVQNACVHNKKKLFHSVLHIKRVLYNHHSSVVWGQCINLSSVSYTNDVRQKNGIQLFIPPLHLPGTATGFTFIIGILSLSMLALATSSGHFNIPLWKRSGKALIRRAAPGVGKEGSMYIG